MNYYNLKNYNNMNCVICAKLWPHKNKSLLVSCKYCSNNWYICDHCILDELKYNTDEYDLSSIGRYLPKNNRPEYIYDKGNENFYCNNCVFDNTLCLCPGTDCQNILTLTNIPLEIELENIFLCQSCDRILCDECYNKDGQCLDCLE